MSETKFTPGPWEKRGFGAYIPGTQKRIADSALAWKSSAETDANAHLIASAPELYAALEEMQWGGLIHGWRCPSCRNAKETGHAKDCALAAALRRARGET